jgi:hypothetical protein
MRLNQVVSMSRGAPSQSKWKAATSAVDAVVGEEGPGAAPTDQPAARGRDATQKDEGAAAASSGPRRRKRCEKAARR